MDRPLRQGASPEWRRISTPPYRSYEVSDDGRVRRGARELKGYVDRYGYRTVLLSYAGLAKRYKVHRLVCEVFHGPCPQGLEARHRNGVRADNRAQNLLWGTRADNMQDAIAHGTFPHLTAKRGEAHHASKFSMDQVRCMRALRIEGWSERKLAVAFNCARGTAHRIVSGKSYVE